MHITVGHVVYTFWVKHNRSNIIHLFFLVARFEQILQQGECIVNVMKSTLVNSLQFNCKAIFSFLSGIVYIPWTLKRKKTHHVTYSYFLPGLLHRIRMIL